VAVAFHDTPRRICRFEIAWPDGTLAQWAGGVDAVQALVHALQIIGALLYTSDAHKRGVLYLDEPGRGYGFPVPHGIRDLLEGDDAKCF
jgi:hypothetical protein